MRLAKKGKRRSVRNLASERICHQRRIILRCALTIIASALALSLLACAASPKPKLGALPSFHADTMEIARGGLIAARPVLATAAGKNRATFRLASLPILSLKLKTGLLAESGFSAWQKKRDKRIYAVQGIALSFGAALVSGAIERQSGLLLLPQKAAGSAMMLSWVVYTKGTELKRDEVPSRVRGYETPIAQILASLGYAVWMPDYSGMGESQAFHEYCVPEGLAASALDGLAAARDYVRGLGNYEESGRLYLMGYSEGGLAAMAQVKKIHEEGLPDLRVGAAYAMGAPLNLMSGVEKGSVRDGILAAPEYSIYLVLAWARAFPERVRAEEILKPEILSRLLPLYDGSRDSEELHRAVASLCGKKKGGVLKSDIYLESYMKSMLENPDSVEYYRAQLERRLDLWDRAPAFPILLAASEADRVVDPANSRRAFESLRAAAPSAELKLLQLRGLEHSQAGAEALIYAIFDIDRREALAPVSLSQ